MTISHNQPVMFTAKRYARLKWACRRGMLELDVLLLPFVEEAFNDLPEQDKETFERLLTCDDPDLFAWIMGHQTCQDPELARMVDTIVNRVKVQRFSATAHAPVGLSNDTGQCGNRDYPGVNACFLVGSSNRVYQFVPGNGLAAEC